MPTPLLHALPHPNHSFFLDASMNRRPRRREKVLCIDDTTRLRGRSQIDHSCKDSSPAEYAKVSHLEPGFLSTTGKPLPWGVMMSQLCVEPSNIEAGFGEVMLYVLCHSSHFWFPHLTHSPTPSTLQFGALYAKTYNQFEDFQSYSRSIRTGILSSGKCGF